MEFKILGPLEVRAGDREVACRGAKQRLLLGMLLLNANEVVSSDRLAEALWGSDQPETTKALQMHVSQLRRSLGAHVIVTRPPGYELRVAIGDVDAHRFELAAREGRAALAAGRAADARRLLHAALGLWRGSPLADLTFEDALQADIARLEELRLVALEARIEADLELGDQLTVVPELERLVAAHPTRERLRAHLMLALYRSGRQADALEVYRDTRNVLVEELGIEPGRDLQQLEAQVLAHDPALDLPPAPKPDEGLIGRDRELTALLPAVDAALAGAGGLLLVAGEPGIGKTRLAEALAARGAQRGARVLVGRCWEAGGAPAYWPWVQALRAHGAGIAELAGATAKDRFQLFEAVGERLAALADESPVAIVLDDVHAADEPSLLLLRFLVERLAGTPVLMVCCYRDTDAGPKLRGLAAELGRDTAAERIALSGLDDGATARLLEQSMGCAPPPGLAEEVHDSTRGNPLFIEELGRLLASGEWTAGRLPIPDGVRETIDRRLAGRSRRCRDMLAVAAVFGREFELELLGEIAGLDESELSDGIEEATAARFIGELPANPGRQRFVHVLMRDAIYNGMSQTHRMRLHRAIASMLERRYGGSLDRHASEIAHHYLHGGEAVGEKALDFTQRAADHAAAQHAHEEAARQYTRALEIVDGGGAGDARRACELLLALGDALSRGGAPANAPFEQAAAIAEREGWPELLAQAALGYGGRFAWGRASVDPGLVPLLERALATVGAGDSPARVRLLGRLAAALRDEPGRERRVALAEEALAMARRLGDPETLGYAIEAHWPAVESPATLDGRLERTVELIALGRQTSDLERVFIANDYRLNTFMTLADRAAVDVTVAAMEELADTLRQPVQLWSASMARTVLALLEGRFADAEQLMDAPLARRGDAYRFNAEVSRLVQLFLLRRAEGRLAEVEPLVAQAVHAYPALHRFRCLLAHVRAQIGDEPGARVALAAATACDLTREFVDEEWLFAMNVLPDACALLRDDECAAQIYTLLAPHERHYAQAPVEGTFGSIARGLGVLTMQLGRLEDAERHLRSALEIERSMRAWPWLALARQNLGELLLRRGDEAAAGEELAAAVAGYRELGMESWAARAAAL
jgi:DNA-binding SARP family transcriptional activator/tetratricopeptide (TPR) repeat protein